MDTEKCVGHKRNGFYQQNDMGVGTRGLTVTAHFAHLSMLILIDLKGGEEHIEALSCLETAGCWARYCVSLTLGPQNGDGDTAE